MKKIMMMGVMLAAVCAWAEDLYCVIDLLGGTEASSYPVSYLPDVPSGGWSDEYKTTKLVLRKINAGTFTMGSPEGEVGRCNTETQHQVTLTKDYYIGVFPVTQRQWELMMGKRPSYFNNDTCYAPRPVEQVSYGMIRGSSAGAGWPNSSDVDEGSFLWVLRTKTGLTLDLPTEAQWEYACRAGTTTALNSGKNLAIEGEDAEMTKVGRYWFNGGSSYSQSCDWSAGTAKVGSYAPNAWGLYDMHGNVLEWCLDWYGPYSGAATDPKGPSSGSERVCRGGSWSYGAGTCRSADRHDDNPSPVWDCFFGFRLCCPAALPEGGPYTETVGGITWTFMVDKSLEAGVVGASSATGDVAIPSALGGRSVTAIGKELLMKTSGITSIVIPEGVRSIGFEAFQEIGTLTSVSLPSTLTNVAEKVFSECSNLSTISMPTGNDHVKVVNGVLYDFGAGTLIVAENDITALSLPDGITRIGQQAFCCGCAQLTNAALGDSSLVSVGKNAFAGCSSLTAIVFPSTLTTIEKKPFLSCAKLSSVTFLGGVPEVGEGLYYLNDGQEITYLSVTTYVTAGKGWDEIVTQGTWQGRPIEYAPGPSPERGIIISFVAPNGESSMERAYFATNRPYGRLPLARREGCTFAGWYTSLDGMERVGAFDQVLPDVKTLYARWAEDEAPLYAQWDPNHYSAVFNPDGGTGEMADQPFIYDQRQALTANAFKKTGYTFKGWATNEAGEVVYADQQVVSNLTAEAGFAVALFAKWEQIMDITEEEIEEWVVYDLAQTYKKPGEKAIDYVKRFKERFGDDYTKAFYAETGKIGQDGTALCVYHDYIAGTDPLDKDSQFTASITFDESGKPVITYKPVLDEEKAAKRIYTTYGKANLTDPDWSVVQPGQEADYRFFKVTIEMRPKN